MADYPISKIQYGSDGYLLRDAKAEAALPGLVDNGAKNLLYWDMDSLKSANPNISSSAWNRNVLTCAGSVTITFNADGTCTLNGTSSAGQTVYFTQSFDLPQGNYIWSAGTLQTKLWSGVIDSGSSEHNYTGSNNYIALTGITPKKATIYIESGTTFSNKVLYPMLTTKAEWNISQSFEKYALPNPTLTTATIKTVDDGAKNLIRFYESASAGGGKSTLNPNGYSVTLSGSSSVTGMALGEILNPGNETYVFKYVSTGTTGNAIVLYDYTTSSNFLVVSGSGSTEISNFDPTHRYGIHSYVGSAMTLNGTVSAMICPKATYDISQEFEPYAFSNPVLSPAVVRAANKGSGKNRLNFDLATLRAKNTYGTWTSSNVYERRGMRFTINSDMSITVVKIGDRDGDAWLDLYGDGNTTDFVGMICSGCPSGGKSGNTEYFSMQCGTNYNYGNPDEQTVTKGAIAIVVRAAYTSSTALTFKPMICTKNDWLMSREYVPYAMTNAELTAKTIKFVDVQCYLNNLVFTRSYGTGSNDGAWYTTANDSVSVPGLSTIYSVSICGWESLLSTNVVQPYITANGTKIAFIANTNTFRSATYLTIRCIGV